MEQTVAPVAEAMADEQRLKMTYEEFLAWADGDKHAEWVEGEVIVFMPPKKRRQIIALFLASLLDFYTRFFNLGTVLPAPFEMKARPDGPSREPDILFVARDHLARLTEGRLEGPADLVVEIISDESVGRDRGDKFYEYQEAGVREYWLFDPRPGKERADFWTLDAAGRYQNGVIDGQGVYRSTVLPGFWLNVAWLLGPEPPSPFAAFAQIVGVPQALLDEFQRLARGSRSNSD